MEEVLSAIMKTILRSSQKGRQPAVIGPLFMRDPDESLPPVLITIHYLAALQLFFLLSCCGMASEIATVRKIAVTHHHKSQIIYDFFGSCRNDLY